jgi:putative acetyltransferase
LAALEITPERPSDAQAIHDLTAAAFDGVPYSDGSEAPIVSRLRADGDLTLSLVAREGRDLVGHIAFSPVSIDGATGDWFGLGPISVRPDRQRQGIGRALVELGLSEMKRRGAAGCALVGSPAFYGRFGFVSRGDLAYGDVPREYVQWIAFDGGAARGVLTYAPAFGAP